MGKDACKRYYYSHREEILRQKKEYRQSHRTEMSEKDKRTYANTREQQQVRKREEQRHIVQSIREFLVVFRENTPCVDCGRYYPHYVMEFDHIRGARKAGVSSLMRQGWKAVLVEIEKCDLVCGNCHNIRTHSRKGVK
jgi:hypothetical protein